MDDNNQVLDQASADGNVMERVLNAFDGLYDNATTFISGAAASAGEIGSNLAAMPVIAGSLSERAGEIGEKAGGGRPGIGAAVGDKRYGGDLRKGCLAAETGPPDRPTSSQRTNRRARHCGRDFAAAVTF